MAINQILILCAVFLSLLDAARAASIPKFDKALASAIHSSGLRESDLAIWIGDDGKLEDDQGQKIFGLNADREMIPASLSKVITGAVALDTFHPGFKFKTKLFASAPVVGGTLSGPIYLRGDGDPTFVSETMWFLVNELTRTGVTQINGDVIVDDSKFDDVRFGPDRQDERVDRAYDAPIGAMAMNWNSVAVFLRPGHEVGDKLQVLVDVMSPYIHIRNETKTVAAGRGKNLTVERVNDKDFFGDTIVVKGALALDQPEAVYYKSISKPDLFAGYNLIEFLKQRGIAVTGSVKTGVTPPTAKELASADSRPMSEIVAEMAKWSSNFVAEMLVKNMSAEGGSHPGTMDDGLKKVHQFIQSRLGWPDGKYAFINAAGFNRKNQLSAHQIAQVLLKVKSDFSIFPEYATALPIAGIDGTLRHRMQGADFEGRVRAKTGLLNGVVGLAGFAAGQDGVVRAFALIYNGSGHEDKARALFDHLAGIVAGLQQ